jgi:hypothetical protein
MRGLIRQETAQVRRANLRQRRDTLAAQMLKAGAHVALIRLAGQLRETALHAAVDQEVG